MKESLYKRLYESGSLTDKDIARALLDELEFTKSSIKSLCRSEFNEDSKRRELKRRREKHDFIVSILERARL